MSLREIDSENGAYSSIKAITLQNMTVENVDNPNATVSQENKSKSNVK